MTSYVAVSGPACYGPMVLECIVDGDERVYPMMRAGKTVDDMVLGDGD